MHELSVTQNVLNIALEHAAKAGARRILQIDLVIGELSSIVDDSVQFYFDIISRGTMAEGARLVFHRIPATFRCRRCGETFPLEGPEPACPRCGNDSMEPIAGTEFYVESIEVE